MNQVPANEVNPNNTKKTAVWNTIIIVLNLLITIVNYIQGFVSYYSMIVLAVNLFVTIANLRREKSKSETVCLVLEIITGIIIASAFIR